MYDAQHVMQKKHTGLYRGLVLLLCLVMLVASFQFDGISMIAGAADDSISQLSVQFNGKEIDSIVLPQDEKRILTVAEMENAEYKWQISTDESAEQWINISGQHKNFLTLSYAMVGSLLSDRGITYVRCIATNAGDVLTSSPIKVTVSYTVPEVYGTSEQTSAVLKAAVKRANALANDADSDFQSHTITINYIYENGNLAFEPYVATIEHGGAFTATVTFPTVVGYLPYFGEASESTSGYTIDISSVTEDVTYTVTYKPALVNYTVRHLTQNILDDNYELHDTTTKQGLTGAEVSGCEIDIDGFSPLFYEKLKIAADGSTEIEIYYDRNYYLVSFDLQGGYGVEPVYTRYGATVSVNKPTRSGYMFDGWELIECGGQAAAAEQKAEYDLDKGAVTLPSMNLKYQAKWITANTTYTVVHWAENADDDGYNYSGSETVSAESGTVVNGSDYAQTIDHFTFNADKTDKNVIVEGDGSTVVNVYYTRNTYTLTFEGTIYDCGYEEHTHTYDGRYRSGGTRYYYGQCYPEGGYGWGGATQGNTICGKTEHTHSQQCNPHTGTVATITAKYDEAIADKFNQAPFNTTYSGRAWECTDTNKFSYALQTLDRMPGFDATFELYAKSSNTKKTINYYVQSLGTTVNSNTWPTNSNNFELLKSVDTYFNYATYNEEYHEIKGFTRYSESVAGFRNSQKDFSNNQLNLYYMRNSYILRFYNYETFITERDATVQYEAPLSEYNFTPEYPSTLEPNAYEFVGWYTTPGCYTGSEVDWNTMTMPDSDLTLYAKWAPKSHIVRVFKTSDMTEQIDEQIVLHGNFATAPGEISNGNYVFNGWFYMDNGEKKAFDFNNMPVNRDLDIFAEWSSKTPVLYTIRYQLEDGTVIADPTIGSTLAGMSKTFIAKGGSELYEGYQEGCFPETNSHTILMNINGGNEFIFTYVAKENVPYTVRYLEKGTETVLHEDKYVAENKKSVVTEVFQQISGYMPDAYQKRLVLSANDEENVLIFWYTKDNEHAYYVITHWVQNLEGDGYTEYRSIQDPETIGKTITEEPLTLTGFTYNAEKSTPSGELTEQGLKLDLYYDRNEYPYKVRYLEYGTETVLHDPFISEANNRFGKTVSATAVDIPGYSLVGEKTKTRTIRDSGNEIIFYYIEQEVTISYKAVPAGTGTVSIGSETVKAKTGAASGSTPAPADGYRFEGWFTDESCTTPVNAEWVDANNKLVPHKIDGLYQQVTYYAKFTENTASLTIEKTGAQDIDENQTFLFRVKGTDENTRDIDITVTVHGNGKTTIADLPVGNYTVTEKTDWSWRYTPEEASKNVALKAGGGTVAFANERKETQWLDGDHYTVNLFGENQ